jgi:glycosyltransferase involved in cell wall biosynthesis
VSLTKYLPFEGIGHAGGEYLQNHYRVVGSEWGLTPIAPDTALNRQAVLKSRSSTHVLVGSRAPLAHDRLKVAADVQSAARGSSAHRWFERAVLQDESLRRLFRTADLIEFQWSEIASLAPNLRQLAPDVPQVIIAHDVITQRWRRAAAQSSDLFRRAAFSSAARASARREALSFSTADAVIVFSEKDAELVRSLAPSANAEVVHPGFAVPAAASRQLAQRPPVVLFTGAMGRPDNDDAARWFIASCWPSVVEAVPDARLIIAGSNPSQMLTDMANRSSSISLTGYVQSLEPYFEGARVAVVPLRTGAGVKFKTIDAMMRGIPVVASSVGAEGIDRPDLIACIDDSPAALAHATATQLRAPDQVLADAAWKWAVATYGHDTYRQRLTALYSALTSDRTAETNG